MARINVPKLKAELALRQLTLLALAQKLRRPVSTLSSWLHDVHAPPAGLAEQIEEVLGLPHGTITGGNADTPVAVLDNPNVTRAAE